MNINLVIPYKGAKAFSMFLYANQLKKEYEKRGHTVIVRQPPMKKITGVERVDDMLTRYIFYPIYLRKKEAKKAPGVFHITDHSYTFLLRFLKRSKTLVTCHDVIPLVFRREVGWMAYYMFYLNVLGLRRVAHIATDSESSKQDIIEKLDIAPENITVVYIAYDKETFTAIEKTLHKHPRGRDVHHKSKFGLMVVGSIFYKNIRTILEAIYLLPKEIQSNVRIHKVQEFTEQEKEYIAKHLSHVEMDVLTIPTTQTIIEMYHASSLLVFTSIYEGFGIPILEAMACGVPVLTSRIASMKEVGGEAVVYADPYNAHDIAQKIQHLYENPAVCRELVGKGREQLHRFTREACAEKMIILYSHIAGLHG